MNEWTVAVAVAVGCICIIIIAAAAIVAEARRNASRPRFRSCSACAGERQDCPRCNGMGLELEP